MAQAQHSHRISITLRRGAGCVLACLSVLPQASAARGAVQIIEPGLYDASTISLRASSGWLGLFAGSSPSQKALRATALEAREAPAPDDLAGEKALRLSARGQAQPLFLVRGLSLKAGEVRSIAVPDSGYEEKPGAIEATVLRWGASRLTLRDVTQRQGDGSKKSWLSLSQGKRSQVLFEYPSRDSAQVFWAGDLDGDGKLDLYAGISHHNYGEEGLLFLSSRARRGQLVGEAAAWSARRSE